MSSFDDERERLVRDIAVVRLRAHRRRRLAGIWAAVGECGTRADGGATRAQGLASATQLMAKLNDNIEELLRVGEPLDEHANLWLRFHDEQSRAEPLADETTGTQRNPERN